jgi:phosphatidylglycerol lysyltransferase
VAFRRRGRFVLVGDGLLADPNDREALLVEFLTFAALNRWHTSYVNVPRNEINLFRRHGCEVTKCGEEPLVRLEHTKFLGKDWEWVRRQENFCRRHGVEFREVDADPNDAAYRDGVAPQLDEISREHIAATLHQRELDFFVSQFDPLDVRDRRLFVAEEGGRVIAFIVCNPGLAGDMWAVEVYRRRRDAIRGVVPALIMHALRTMQAEGVGYASLSLCPFLRCTPVAGDSKLYRWVVNFWWRRLSAIYDMPGLFHFKSRFRPDYREMYIAAYPRVTVRSLWSIAMQWRLLHFNPLRLAARLVSQSHGAERRQLAMPDRSADRLIRDLRAKPARVAVPAAQLLATVAEPQTAADLPHA